MFRLEPGLLDKKRHCGLSAEWLFGRFILDKLDLD
jgi:hypothetical protein